MRRTLVGCLTAAAFGVVALTAAAALDPWADAHARLGYAIYKPKTTLGYKVSSFGYQACPGGKRSASFSVTYGSYRGVRGPKTKGFDLFEGSPVICSDPGEHTANGTRTIGGVKAIVGVYCDPTRYCSLADGVKNGYILLWKRGATRIQMDGAHITLARLLEVARSLVPVR